MKTNTNDIVTQSQSLGRLLDDQTIMIGNLMKMRALLVQHLSVPGSSLESLANIQNLRARLIETKVIDPKCIAALIVLDYVSSIHAAVPYLRRALELIDWRLRSAVMQSVAATEKFYHH